MLGIAQSMKMSFDTSKRSARESYAHDLATQKLEELLSISAVNVTTANNGTESLYSHGVSYTRVTTVVVNADSSRTITVAVTGVLGLAGNATVSATVSLWGNT